jgi:hypothetical protein
LSVDPGRIRDEPDAFAADQIEARCEEDVDAELHEANAVDVLPRAA